MSSSSRSELFASLFASLHRVGEPLLLPNAWDVASAVAIAAAGARAVATTSAGVAWSLGVPDAGSPDAGSPDAGSPDAGSPDAGSQPGPAGPGGLGADRAAAVIERIAAAVEVPVSADIEAGYGDSPDAVARTVAAVVRAGAIGVNLEDRRDAGGLHDLAAQADRIAAARAAAGDTPIWINARTDVFLSGAYPVIPDGVAEALKRAAGYAEAGADSVFVPGLIDLDAIAELVAGPLPVAVMAGPGAPSVAEFASVGVVRVSVGSAIAQAAYGLATRAAAEMLTAGTYDSCAGGVDYAEMNARISGQSRTK